MRVFLVLRSIMPAPSHGLGHRQGFQTILDRNHKVESRQGRRAVWCGPTVCPPEASGFFCWGAPEIIQHFAIDSIASKSIKPCDGGVFEALKLLLKVERTACGFMACFQSARGAKSAGWRGIGRSAAWQISAGARWGSKNLFRVWPWAGFGSRLGGRNLR